MSSLPNPPTNGNVPLRERVRDTYQRISAPDSATIAEAAREHFRHCFAIKPRNSYDEAFSPFELMVKLAVDKAVRSEWQRCEEFAQQIADDAVRRAYATEIQS